MNQNIWLRTIPPPHPPRLDQLLFPLPRKKSFIQINFQNQLRVFPPSNSPFSPLPHPPTRVSKKKKISSQPNQNPHPEIRNREVFFFLHTAILFIPSGLVSYIPFFFLLLRRGVLCGGGKHEKISTRGCWIWGETLQGGRFHCSHDKSGGGVFMFFRMNDFDVFLAQRMFGWSVSDLYDREAKGEKTCC